MTFWRSWQKKQLDRAVDRAIEQAVDKAVRSVYNSTEYEREKAALKEEIANLKIDRDRKLEEFNRREREVEHKVGLERKRQEFEIAQSKRETTVAVKEENLKADKDRFKAEMEFQRQRLEGEVKSLREMVGEMLKRLPSAEIYAQIGGRKDDGE